MKETGRMLRQILAGAWDEVSSGKAKTVFLDGIQSKVFDQSVNAFLKGLDPKPTVYRGSIPANTYLTPYYPFFEFIREGLAGQSEENVAQILQQAGVYSLHQPLLTSFITQGVPRRTETIIPEELDYEEKQLYHSILSPFCYWSQTAPVIVIVEDLHLANVSTWQLFQYLVKRREINSSLLFIVTLTKSGRGFLEEKDNLWVDFIQLLELEGLLLDFSTGRLPRREEHDYCLEIPVRPEELIDLSRSCLSFFALRECRKYIIMVYDRYFAAENMLSLSSTFEMLHILGEVFKFLKEYDTSLIYFNLLLSNAQQANNIEEICNAKSNIGFIYLMKDDIETAESYCNRSLKLATKVSNEHLIFSAYFLLFLIQEKGRMYNLKHWDQTYRKIINMGKKLGMLNTLAYCFTNPYGSYSQYTEVNDELYNQGINIAKQLGNKYRLAAAYQSWGMIKGIKGDYPEAFQLYQKSEALKVELDNKLELSYIYNGLGFYHYMIEDYKNACHYYNKAMICLRSIRNYHELAMTLFNIGFTLTFAFQHEVAIQILEKMLRIMNVLRMGNLTYHSMYAIYSILGMLYCKTGNYDKAYECHVKIETKGLKPYPKNAEESFCFHMFQALLLKGERKFNQADKEFQKALRCFKMYGNNIDYLKPRFYYEYALLRQEQGDKEKARELLAQGCLCCEELKYPFYKFVLQKAMAGSSHEPAPIDLGEVDLGRQILDLEWIIESALLESNLTKLHKKYNELNFLNTMQNLLEQTDDRQEMVNKVMEFFNYGFDVEASFLFMREEQDWKLAYASIPLEQVGFDPMELMRVLVFESNPRRILNVLEEPLLKPFGAWLRSMVSIPLFRKGEYMGAMVCVTFKRELVLSNNDIKVFSIASRQLAAALDRIDREEEIVQKNQELALSNQKLLLSSITDKLTGLYNRQELHKRLEEENQRLVRYANKAERCYALIFIDLDNFKHYNDNFGRQIGDLILCSFSNLLRDLTREIDFISQYGTDEFVLMLPETNTEGAAEVAMRIKYELVRRRQFQQEIEAVLGRAVYIPEQSKLTCSMGITECNTETLVDNNTLLQQADEGLSLAKKSGKNRHCSWKQAAQAKENGENGK